MKVQSRFVILVILATLVYAGGLIVTITLTTSALFTQTELGFAAIDLERLDAAVQQARARLETQARDYGSWDETWNFVHGRNPGFPGQQLPLSVRENLGINLVAMTDENGKQVLAQSNAAWSLLPEPVALPDEWLQSGSAFRRLDGQLYQTVCLPIARTGGGGEGLARLLFAYVVDERFISNLSAAIKVPSQLLKPGSTAWNRAAESLGPAGRILDLDPSGDRVTGLLRMQAGDGSPACILQTATRRTLSVQLPRINSIIGTASLVMGLALAVLVWVGFHFSVSRPLIRLAMFLDNYDFQTPDELDGSGLPKVGETRSEIGTIVRVFGDLSQRLSASLAALRSVNTNLEAIVAERTGALVDANHQLTRYAQILSDTSEGVLVTDLDGTVREVNDALCRMSGFSREELLGANPRVMKSNRHPPEFYHEMWANIAAFGRWTGEVWDRRKNGEVYPKWLSITTLVDGHGQPTSYVGLSSDISRIKEAEDRLNQLAYYDSLTGLPNRALFMDRFALALSRAQRGGYRVALIYLDLDRFKLVNDTLGHSAGDNLLLKVGTRLVSLVRESDTVSRLGGDEFTVILENLSRSEDVVEVARKVIAKLSEPFDLDGHETFIGASIGISLFPYDGLDSAELIRKADGAMYQAKQDGRGKFRFASGAIDLESHRRLEIEAGLRRAIAREELVLHYQPQYAAGTRGIPEARDLVGAEALLRWNRDGIQLLGPGAFIDIAEDSDLICEFGAWALRTAAYLAAGLARAGHPIVISVNVSTRQFAKGDLADTVREILGETKLDPALLKLEITESLFMKNIEQVIAGMQAIRLLGVSFAVDDFGVGFSSLQYLTRLPLDCLKIDKSFIDGMDSNQEKALLVSAVISLARSLNLSSVAEGVETAAQLEMLQSRGCDLIQGYFTGRPMPEGAFRQLVLEGKNSAIT